MKPLYLSPCLFVRRETVSAAEFLSLYQSRDREKIRSVTPVVVLGGELGRLAVEYQEPVLRPVARWGW